MNLRRTLHLNRKVIGPLPPRPSTARERSPSDFPHSRPAHLEVAGLLSSPALLGPPLCEQLVRFVEHVFTEEEATCARRLAGVMGRTAAEVARAEGRPVEEVEPILERLAFEKGAISSRGPVGKRHYGLLPVVPGMIELVLAGATTETLSDWQRGVAVLFDELFDTGYLAHYAGASSPFIRYIPARGAIAGEPAALPSDHLEEVLDRFDVFSLIDCECRIVADVQGRGCGKPKGVCMAMGDWADAAIAGGYMKPVSKRTAIELKKEAEAEGLINFVINKEGATGQASCSCCGCCCYIMRALNEFSVPAFSARPHFVPEFDRSSCRYCGRCAQRCPVGALAVEPKTKRAWEIPGRCIGCGQCVLACEKNQAVRMRPVPDYDAPPASWASFLSRTAPGAARRAAEAWWRRSPLGRFIGR